ncbi:hypothetical protein HKX54_14345 [Sulfitobacter sp. M57]|uniref:hypothetical protein n=1 Tax=unclassified Sulfitobacter TaxID=196795 RepID=UPI0023E11433|nr:MULTISPECIES: hypothetical protein [unclassified Sulfitobacter]MDF3415649.1 hypothetical protein [Sulfitobacter sp. KE5]MDF3423129.1 hypothetical protein [Sulfitobacter sp. KE43]MDF3434195.1 hypothetical protein [Sulfitobacter sp. KE42]MDF3459772.1 hypothetical protein [Sulfitobacter sp. S74]MDF3463733.1 hypothetical protein [Sulfitobacter sp. Ks18]
MREARDIAAKIEVVQALLTRKLGLKRARLEKMLGRAGRQLPKRVQAKARALAEAQRLAEHPKLARQIDGEAVTRDFADVTGYLEAIDVADLRRGRMLGMAGSVVFNLLLVAAAFVLWLWWRGYV